MVPPGIQAPILSSPLSLFRKTPVATFHRRQPQRSNPTGTQQAVRNLDALSVKQASAQAASPN